MSAPPDPAASDPAASLAAVDGLVRHLAGNGTGDPPWSLPALRTSHAVQALYDRVLGMARENLEHAATLAEGTLLIAGEVGDANSIGLATRALANVRYLESRHEIALELYAAAVACFRQLPGKQGAEEIARTQSSAIQTLAYLARYDQAIQWGTEARAVFAANGDRLRLARLDGNLANLHFRLDRFEEALECYLRAREEFAEAGSAHDVAAVMSNLATCYISLSRFDEAQSAYEEARAHCTRHGFPLLVAQADYNIAYLYMLRGEHRDALRLYADARRHASAAGDAYHAALCDLDQAEMMLELNLLRESTRLARLAMRGFRRLAMRYERAKAGAFLAASLTGSGYPAQAARVLRAARGLFATEGNLVWAAFLDLHRATVAAESGEIDAALPLAEAALRALSEQEVPGKAILAGCVLASIQRRAGMAADAERGCRRALDQAEAIRSPGLLFRCQFLLGEILRDQGRVAESLAAFEAARERLEALWDGIPDEELRIRFFADKTTLFDRLVHFHLDEPALPVNPRTAWQCVQRAKSRTFVEAFSHRSPRIAATGQRPHPVAALRQELQRCYACGTEAELRGDGAEARKWRTRSNALEERLRDELAQLRLALGDGAELGAAIPSRAADLDDSRMHEPDAVNEALPADAAFIEYFCTPERVFAFVLEPGRPLRAIGLGASSDIRAMARLAQFQLSNYHVRRASGQPVEESWPPLAAHLERLHAAIIEPVEAGQHSSTWILAPHAFLHGLPFAALGSTQQPLTTRVRILRTLSASAYTARLRANGAPHTVTPMTPPLVLSVPDARAPLIASEVRRVADHLPGAVLREGAAASMECLRDEGATARMIHIASHGLFRSDNPMFSAIRLGEGNLTVLDLHDLRFRAELVTLSGCSTGVHTVIGGDELLGLSRGFFYAGARRLLLTLWDVNDASTARFMDLFYGQISRKQNIEAALQQAGLALRREYPHPYHWSAFSLVTAGMQEGRG